MKSRFVLFSDGQDFYVNPKVGTKLSYKHIEWFEGFFETEQAAWQEAIRRTNSRIKTLNSYVARYNREIKHAKK